MTIYRDQGVIAILISDWDPFTRLPMSLTPNGDIQAWGPEAYPNLPVPSSKTVTPTEPVRYLAIADESNVSGIAVRDASNNWRPLVRGELLDLGAEVSTLTIDRFHFTTGPIVLRVSRLPFRVHIPQGLVLAEHNAPPLYRRWTWKVYGTHTRPTSASNKLGYNFCVDGRDLPVPCFLKVTHTSQTKTLAVVVDNVILRPGIIYPGTYQSTSPLYQYNIWTGTIVDDQVQQGALGDIMLRVYPGMALAMSFTPDPGGGWLATDYAMPLVEIIAGGDPLYLTGTWPSLQD